MRTTSSTASAGPGDEKEHTRHVPAQPSTWSRTERLDAGELVKAIHDLTGLSLTIDRPCPGGQVGAVYVRWPDDHRAVLTWQPHTTMAALQRGPFAVVNAQRSAGYPAPATELAVQVGHAVALVHQLLPGAKLDHLDHHLLDQALALNNLQAGQLTGRHDIPTPCLFLRTDGPGFCLHSPLPGHNARTRTRTRTLERRISDIGTHYPERLAGNDAVHFDFHPGNMLAREDTISGVVDWDGAGRGDRRLDLVTLRFGIHAKHADPDIIERIDALLDAIPDTVLTPMWAHMSLRMIDWAIRHFTDQAVERWLDLAEQRLLS